MFQVKVQKNIARLTVQEKMTSGSQDVYVVGFEFSEEWAYLERTAVFKSGDIIINVLLDDTNQCLIPWEVLTNYDATVSMGVFGTKDGHVVLPTIWAKTDPILEGVVTGVYPSEPTPDVYQQLLARLSQLEEDIENGAIGKPGATFVPSVSDSGELSWTNDGGLPNPNPVNVIGPKGDKGDDGAAGAPGPQGPSGKDGQPGEKGDKGDKGDTGLQGPAGANGSDGAPGPQGPAGQNGSSAYQIAVDNGFVGTEQEWLDSLKASGVSEEQVQQMIDTSVGQIELTPGPQGKPGVIFTPSVSNSGELTWTNDGGLNNPSPVNIKGQKGDVGEQGPQGIQGEKGEKGEQGPQGIQGEQGATGQDGAPGSAGKDATINGQNTLEIVAGENVTIEQKDGALTINATGGAPVLQSLDITTPPDKVSYAVGDTFDSAGMDLTATYQGEFFKNPKDYTVTPDGPLQEGVDKVTVSYTENNVTVTAEQPISVTSTHIYGVTWDGTSTTKWTRTDEAALFTDPVPYVAGANSHGSPFDSLMPWAGMVKEERTGGTMVAIPKFWYKLEQNTPDTPSSGMSIKIADGPVDGFSVSPAHMDRGDGKGERDIVYVGRYHCGSNYKSTTGVNPMVNIARNTARTGIHSLGENIWQIDFMMRFTIWLLYLVEFADWNSQDVIGYDGGNGNMGYTDSIPYHTGTTLSDRKAYGLGTQYRNIEGLWGNVFDWVDGIYNSANDVNIIVNPNNYSENSEGVSIGNLPSSSQQTGVPTSFDVNNKAGFPIFFPKKENGTTSTYSCDMWIASPSYPNVCAGGYHGNTLKSGLFCISFASPEGIVGTRLQELP